jgi:hypothetical protein
MSGNINKSRRAIMSTSKLFTVATIRKSEEGEVREFLFNESPRIFRLEQMPESAARSAPEIVD